MHASAAIVAQRLLCMMYLVGAMFLVDTKFAREINSSSHHLPCI